MIKYFIAIMFVCGVGGECGLYQDLKGPSSSIEECRVKLDALWQRILVSPDAVNKLGEFSHDQFEHKGFCIDSTQDNAIGQIRKYYER
jgi:hypothetical protein